MTTMIMILTPSRAFPFRLDEWGRDSNRDVHVYDGGTTVATFDASSVVAVFQNLTPDDFDRLVESLEADVADVIDPNNQNEAENTTNT